MNPEIALYGWPVVAVLIFAFLPPRRAVLVSILAGWMFLPVAYIELPGVQYDRWVACSIGSLLGALIFDFKRFLGMRPGWIDIPIFLLCLCPIPTSLANGLGFYDGFHDTVHRLLRSVIPYALGRIYFHDPKGLREVVVGVFVGGLVYMPLCLFEARMSPTLHMWVYGYHQHDWGQTMRFGGWRPTVFMTHGLEVGMWMTAASLAGIWLWMSGVVRRILHIPIAYLVPPLLVTALVCKSIGALVLLGCGVAALGMTRWWPRTKLPLIVLILCPIAYIAGRSTGIWSGDEIVTVAKLFGEDRAQSVQYRFMAEDGLARHAMRQPILGWGGWGRNRPSTFEEEELNLATDGLWIITLGCYGFVGLAGLLGTFLLPPLLLVWRLKTDLWSHPWCAPAALLAVVLTLMMIDSLMNAMINPIHMLAAGGLSRAVCAPLRRRAVASAQPAVVEGRLGIS
jgi:hypothetical protein